jgi:hypothetical protein
MLLPSYLLFGSGVCGSHGKWLQKMTVWRSPSWNSCLPWASIYHLQITDYLLWTLPRACHCVTWSNFDRETVPYLEPLFIICKSPLPSVNSAPGLSLCHLIQLRPPVVSSYLRPFCMGTASGYNVCICRHYCVCLSNTLPLKYLVSWVFRI